MVDVVKTLVWAAAMFNMVAVVEALVIDVLAGVEIIVVDIIVNVLKFALPVPYSVDASSDVAVDLLMLGVLPGIGIAVLADVNANAFTVAMTALEFPVSTPLENCSR